VLSTIQFAAIHAVAPSFNDAHAGSGRRRSSDCCPFRRPTRVGGDYDPMLATCSRYVNVE
jgi:hypothetical protein